MIEAQTTKQQLQKQEHQMRQHFHTIYDKHSTIYDRLVEREDFAGNLLKTLRAIVSLEGLEVVEWGAGTGRVTRLLAPEVRTLQAFDGAEAMLDLARQRTTQWSHLQFQVALHHEIPVEDNRADLGIEGWSFAHLTEELPENEGLQAVQQALKEMQRVVRPGGMMVLIETLGTGTETPAPSERLQVLYEHLEKQGFQHRWCRTDYRFSSQQEAEELLGFFFGQEMLEKLNREEWTLPECTGFWFRQNAR